MATRRTEPPPPIEPRDFRSVEEIGLGIAKLERRVHELEALDIPQAIMGHNGADKVVESNIKETIREVFGANSPEFAEHQLLSLWSRSPSAILHTGSFEAQAIHAKTVGRRTVLGILNGLIDRLREKREDLLGEVAPAPSTYFDRLNLHPRIREVSRDLFTDGYCWDAVFAAAKALVNYVKERSGCDLDGAPLMRTVFSKNNPILAFNDLSNKTDEDEQEGMMHLFEGAVLGVRNPGGHSFPEGTEQRAIEYISLLSLLAYRVQEAKRHKAQ